jgi:hypothetical protein
MPDEIPISKKTAEDAKKRTKSEPEAVREARERVQRHVESGKPGPSTDNVDSAPKSNPKA